MSFFEIEQKYRLKDPSKIRRILKKANAKRIAGGIELNEFYDKGNFFRKQKIALRLRRYGHGLAALTLKGPQIQSGFTKRMEIETPIEYITAKKILSIFGYKPIRRYSKKREIYKLGKAFVAVDLLKKHGWFLEIEGQPRQIKKIEKRLGLQARDREERSYLQMLFHWKQ